MKGSIRISKKILSWRWYKDINTKTLFFHLIITACKENSCVVDDVAITTGQCLITLRNVSEECGLSLSQTRRALKKLAETGEIDMHTNKKYTLITLLNFEKYQTFVNPTQDMIIENNNDKYLKRAISNQQWIETMCMHNSISPDHLKFLLKKFMDHLNSGDSKKKNYNEFVTHFRNWLRYQKKDESEVPGDEMYIYTWKGMHNKRANHSQYMKDKRAYDHPGFDFTLIKIEKDE